jgi:phospholipid/cholesterol/gamma-HCH transport system substrate-binding protein
LASQGVTGVSYVGLEGGAADAPRLQIDASTGVAEIPSKTTVVQGLLADAPDLLAKAISVLDDMGRFSTQENADHVTAILANVDQATARLGKVMDDMTTAAASFSQAADKISSFSAKLDGVAASANSTMADARAALANFDKVAIKGLPQITALTEQGARLLADLTNLTSRIERDPARFFLGNRTPEYTR